MTDRTAQLFSGWQTPRIASGRWGDNIARKNGTTAGNNGFAEKGIYDTFDQHYDHYLSWNSTNQKLISTEEIQRIFMDLSTIFGFQTDNTKNMFDYLLRLLDSRSSRMQATIALRTLHADYIGGENSNFRKWYFAARLDIDDTIGFYENSELKNYNREETERAWKHKMHNQTPKDCVIQLALYLLCWGEASNIRFMPECLCFIFKCCNDYYYSLDHSAGYKPPPIPFLDHVITPLYNFYRDQNYELINGKYARKSRDHYNTIGYDDMNQLFWYDKGLKRLTLKTDKSGLMEMSNGLRYLYLNDVNWDKCFYKTYKEKRTWNHLIVNFNRIWIIHCCTFWYYISYNSLTLYTKNYKIHTDNQPTLQATLTAMSFAGTIATLVNIFATFLELTFVPRKWPGAESVSKRLFILFVILIINFVPSLYVFLLLPLDKQSVLGLFVSVFQFVVSLISVGYFSVVPLGSLFGSYLIKSDSYVPSKIFTASVHKLQDQAFVSSVGLWSAVFLAKSIESYFFLILSFKDTIRELSIMRIKNCNSDIFFGNFLCEHQPKIVLSIMYFTELILFFLDTYLWYIIWNTVFSVCRSFYMGVSIWTPWRNIFSRLPKRIYSKIIYSQNKGLDPKNTVSQIWNSIIISMYSEHLISFEHFQKLIYQHITETNEDYIDVLKEPAFFISQEDSTAKSTLFENQTEAQRRITFFAQSLSTPMHEVCSIDQMPSFSVLIPHYSEKITLSLKEIIKEEDEYAHVTLLEYLKQLHPLEWRCFVEDSKMLAEEIDTGSELPETASSEKEKFKYLPYFHVGFKSATPEHILRTRIWASLRSQTLYRTISGFMNYSRAIKLLYDVENPVFNDNDKDEEKQRFEEIGMMALRKFRLVVSMQRMSEFSQGEEENKDFLLRAYPELQIAYLEKQKSIEDGGTTYYSSLIDGTCELDSSGKQIPKYRIKLPGNPIMGDGKSDNQNNSLIFCRGEYIQLVDANQDNYLEECLKIRNILAEFEETTYNLEFNKDTRDYEIIHKNPVAIIGTREYIFSENIGILGDVAAGKEQTFGTLFARTLAQIGGKLHYGHPDFLNGVFMTTRGGVSKAQKGLHLNEDIYAGMNAILRGGRIKHCEYMQCGKGRDLGFGSILNFTTKIGAGMGEQMLSREYFYLGTQLPLDRFLSFYYGHPGFHLNNVFIILSIKLLILVAVQLSSLSQNGVICKYDKNVPITDPRKPNGCYNLAPIVGWLNRCILSIFIVFGISFVPLCVQEIMERGIWKAITRLSKHFLSLSPLFEIFVCKIYAQSLINDIAVGGAKYIATGRGFATIRVHFSDLYARFATESISFGAFSALLVFFCIGTVSSLSSAWFLMTIIGLSLSPFIYNPNQFSFKDFFIDYSHYLKWISSGNSKGRNTSWIKFTKELRAHLTGSKRKARATVGDKLSSSFRKPSTINVIFDEILGNFLFGTCLLFAFLFINVHKKSSSKLILPSYALVRITIVTLGPILFNALILLALFFISLTLGPLISFVLPKFPAVMAFIAHGFSFLNHVFFFHLLWFFQKWNFTETLLGYAICVQFQNLIFNFVTVLFISRELPDEISNKAWWSGKWIVSGLGRYTITQPLREYFCKIIELSMFAKDFTIGHILLFLQYPIVLIPGINKWHSLMLFWLKPSKQIRPQILTTKRKQKQNIIITSYFFIFNFMLLFFMALFLLPIIIQKFADIELLSLVPENIEILFN